MSLNTGLESRLFVARIIFVGAFVGVDKLRSLDLCDNALDSLDDGTFYGLDELSQLDVSSNRLTTLTPRALTPVARSLNYLNLFDNRLRVVDFTQLAEVEGLSYVGLSNNSWVCNCSLRLEDDVGSEALRAAREVLVCEYPPDARGELLPTVLEAHRNNCAPYATEPPAPTLRPPHESVDSLMLVVVVLAVTLTLLTAGVLCVVVTAYRRRRRSAVWTPCHALDGQSSTSSIDDCSQQKLGHASMAADRCHLSADDVHKSTVAHTESETAQPQQRSLQAS